MLSQDTAIQVLKNSGFSRTHSRQLVRHAARTGLVRLDGDLLLLGWQEPQGVRFSFLRPLSMRPSR